MHKLTKTLLSALLLLFTVTQALAQRSINDADRVTLHGNVHPLARAEFDRGSADPNMAMDNIIMSLSVRPSAQAALAQLLKDQQDPKSPSYHKWLTPQQFAARFGATDQDITDVTNWLKSHGFHVNSVANGRMSIMFSGKVQQVEQAFQTNIRQYQVSGKMHHANATDPTMPRAFVGMVNGLVSLNDFPKHRNSNAHQLPPLFNNGTGTGTHFLAPGDFATIYNVNPLYTAGIDGTGQNIAIVGRTNIHLSDVQAFRSFFSLPANNPMVIVNGPDPGDLGGDEETEALLDVEWSGAVAKNATIDFVVSASTSTTDGVDLSASYIVNNNLANVMSTSFGLCEAALGAAGNMFWNSLWSQAATQGITSFVASGDSGAAGCDGSGSLLATGGAAVSGVSSTPFNIAVGGTEFNDAAGTFWADGNNPDQSSALGYIPEVVWNESGTTATGSGLFASGGGVSTQYTKPAFQIAPGVPADGQRDVPDVSLTSALHDGYMIIQGNTPTSLGLQVVGGTSAASPSFAGIMALVVQKTGSAQGNANNSFYFMASNQAMGGIAVFHDITSGDNSVPGVAGFSASPGPGYDLATGLGSVDAANLVNFWNNNAADFSIAAAPASQSVTQGGTTGNYTITLSTINGFAGTANLTVTGLPAGATPTFGSTSVAVPGSTTLSIATAATTPVGTYTLTITAASGTLTHSTTVSLVVNPTPDFTLSMAPGSQTINAGDSTSFTASIGSIGGYASTVTLSVSGVPAGATPTFVPGNSVVAPGSVTLSLATTTSLAPGSYPLTITATDGTLTHSAGVTLVVNQPVPPPADFTLSVFPASQTVQAGQNSGYGISIAPVNGFTGVVVLSVNGLPANSTGTIAPSSIATSGTTNLTVNTTLSTAPGMYTLTIRATSGNLVHTGTVTLNVTPPPPPDFTVTADPNPVTIKRGTSGGTTLSGSGSNGFTGTITFALGPLPALVTANVPTSVKVPPPPSVSALNLNVDKKAKSGTYTINVICTSGAISHTVPVTLIVP